MKKIQIETNNNEYLDLTEVLRDIIDEIEKANKVHGVNFNSTHEWYGVLQEEFDELWDEIKQVKGCYIGTDNMKKEAIQIAAMAIKGILSLCNK